MIEKKEKYRNNSQGDRKMDEDSQADSKQDMVATLQARKEVLEAELSNKNKELKMLCIQEAELTGILPPETPLEPGESPPVFRRRVGTVFTYPENLLSNKKSSEEDTLTALELECKIQRGIAEAALGLANEAIASKAVRRKHRLMYQQSQQRLAELETKLNTLRQASGKRDQKQRKKPRPPLGCENEPTEREDLHLHGVGVNLSPLQQDTEQYSRAYWDARNTIPSQAPYLKHSATYGGRSHHEAKNSRSHLSLQRHASGGHIVYSPNNTVGNQYYLQTNLDNQDYNCWSQNTAVHGDKVWYATAPRQNTEHGHWEKDRFGSLDRRQYHNASVEARNAEDAVRQSYLHYHARHVENKNHSPVAGVLLPNQTYPDHSLGAEGQIQTGHVPLKSSASLIHTKEYKPQVPVDYKIVDTNREKRSIVLHKDYARRHERQNIYTDHGLEYNVFVNCHVSVDPEATVARGVPRTQSLGSMESHDMLGRKQKEKQWYETSLDSSPAPLPQPTQHENDEERVPPPPDSIPSPSCSNSVSGSEHGSQNFDIYSTEVPFESPQNHTVVQPGKWQPYREVTKPFEMSDFYKYSTKFRKMRAQQEAEAQQKAARVPPQAVACQALSPDCGRNGEIFSAELLQWYQDRNIPCSATLV